MLGWSALDIPMLLILPVLLCLSGFFSGSETALFGLTEMERMTLRSGGSFVGRAVDALLANQRMLLITILVGNMTVNVLYFVITSVLLMETNVGVLGSTLLGVGFLVLVILLGEVTPKLLANSRRTAFVAVIAAPLLTFHHLLAPLRLSLDTLLVSPLSRLTSPTTVPAQLDERELAALLEISSHEGVIDREEQRILQDVITLRQQKVRDVMTPRVRMAALPVTASRPQVIERVRQTRLTNLPVYRRDLDHIVGMLPVKQYLLNERARTQPPKAAICRAQFVPEVATLDQLLHHFRESRTEVAIVVDEYGGTAGVVSLEDVVEEIVGDIASTPERRQADPILIGHNRWRISGDAGVREWAESFGQPLVSRQVTTLGGLIVARLGRAPHLGDVVELGNIRLEVEQVDRSRVVSLIVSLIDEPPQESQP